MRAIRQLSRASKILFLVTLALGVVLLNVMFNSNIKFEGTKTLGTLFEETQLSSSQQGPSLNKDSVKMAILDRGETEDDPNDWLRFTDQKETEDNSDFWHRYLDEVETGDDDLGEIDGDGWRQLTIHDAISRFKSQMGDECFEQATELVCPNPVSDELEPGQVRIKGCTTIVDIQTMREAASVTWPPSLRPLYKNREYILPFEGRLLKDPPLMDLKLLPDVKLSRVVALSPADEKFRSTVIKCEIGKTVEIQIDLVDGYGNARTKGDDDVRVWVKRAKARYSAVADVTDLKNGSYHAVISCFFEHTSELSIAVVYPREYLRAVVNNYRLQSARQISMMYTKKKAVSITSCGATPVLPYTCMCNFTGWNKQTFYCGHPAHPDLKCKDASHLRSLWFREPVNLTETEIELFERMSRCEPGSLIKHRFAIQGIKTEPIRQVPCPEVPFEATWNALRPKGYWVPGPKWKSTICDNSRYFTNTDKCFRNLRIWIIGDSNGIRLARALVNHTMTPACVFMTWPKIVTCFNKATNSRLDFYPHEYPLFLPNANFYPIEPHGGIPHLLESVPPNPDGKSLFVVHYFMHTTPFHVTALKSRMENLRDAMIRAVAKNPELYVVLRGPHTMYHDWTDYHHAGGDVLVSQTIPMIKEIFRPVWNNVIFLDGYDYTVAIENLWVHPDNVVPDEMIRLVFNLICGRKIERKERD